MPFRKRSNLAERLETVKEELAAVRREIRRLSKLEGSSLSAAGGQSPADSSERTKAVENGGAELFPKPRAELQSEPGLSGSGERGRYRSADARFKNYLASSFQKMHPLRYERRMQRNKAIVMLIFVFIILVALLRSLRSCS